MMENDVRNPTLTQTALRIHMEGDLPHARGTMLRR